MVMPNPPSKFKEEQLDYSYIHTCTVFYGAMYLLHLVYVRVLLMILADVCYSTRKGH
jgi:hypothetical protein